MPQRTEDYIKESLLAHGLAVVCGFPEEKRLNINYSSCEDKKNITVQDVLLKFTGRKLKISVNLKTICTGKIVALGVLLHEKVGDEFISKGVRVCEINIPKDENDTSTNILAENFCFTFPEWNLCVPRTFKICIIAHYLFPNHLK